MNVIPVGLRHEGRQRPWWEDEAVAELESEWKERGTIAGVRVPSAYRSFVYKTVIALRASELPVTARTIADSAARWLPERDAEELRQALLEENGEGSGT